MKQSANNYAFIDGNNLHYAMKDLGWKLDYRKFRIYLQEKYYVTKAYIFIGFLEENLALYSSLQRSGYELIFKPAVRFDGNKVKGNVPNKYRYSVLLRKEVTSGLIAFLNDLRLLLEYKNSAEWRSSLGGST